ncbi:hypothetical protein D6827_01510 [Candidatus Parcubacteria bacterium]|nr:MAG: hypothetical protein D6827_01510 [Candidatus Parcubacteria bacterium]
MGNNGKRQSRRYQKNAVSLNDIINSALSRHGIARQVTAAMAVKKAQAILLSLIDDVLHDDMRVISFTDNILNIACRHPAAAHHCQRIEKDLIYSLHRELPSITVEKINYKINPHLLDSGSEIGV